MTWPLYVGLVCVVLVGIGVWLTFSAEYGDDTREGVGSVLIFGPGLGALVFLLMGTIIPISRHYDRAACDAFQTQTGRESRFVVYHTFSWACLVRTADGKWIPRDQLREFGEDAP